MSQAPLGKPPQKVALTCGPEVKFGQPRGHPKSQSANNVMTQTTHGIAESVHIETASSSDSNSSDKGERGNHQVRSPMAKLSHHGPHWRVGRHPPSPIPILEWGRGGGDRLQLDCGRGKGWLEWLLGQKGGIFEVRLGPRIGVC